MQGLPALHEQSSASQATNPKQNWKRSRRKRISPGMRATSGELIADGISDDLLPATGPRWFQVCTDGEIIQRDKRHG
jgi:hypothetical protein